MWDFSTGQSLSALLRTLPFLGLRALVYFGVALAYIFAAGIGAGLGYGAGAFGSEGFRAGSTIIGCLLGVGLVGAAFYILREYILYMVKAGHIAVLSEVLSGHDIPAGETQIHYARHVVGQRFAEANMLFALDLLIKGVIRVITSVFNALTSAVPMPSIDALMNFFNAVIKYSLSYVDEVILAYIIRTKSTNPWASARDALVLYAQNGWTMLRNAIALTIICWIMTILVFMFLLAPAAGILYFFPGDWSGWSFIAAFILAWACRAALIEPFAIACLMQVFFKTIEGQTPNPEWEARLNNASEKFRDIARRAAEPFPQQSTNRSPGF